MSRLAAANTLLRRYSDVVLCLLLLLLFQCLPQIDMQVAGHFWRTGHGFWLANQPLLVLVYEIFLRGWILGVLILLLLLARLVSTWRARLPRTATLCFLLASLFIGPGLMVNVVLKNHMGRPRPFQVKQFGGTYDFLPAASLNSTCGDNCASFVSGHAAMGFYLMSFYWVGRQRRWLVLGISAGLLVGLARMAMGGHFLSDVLFAGLMVHFTARGLAWLILPRTLARGDGV